MSFSFNFELTEEDCLHQHQSDQPQAKTQTQTQPSPACVENSDENCNNEDRPIKSNLPAYEVESFYDESVISKLEKRVLNLNDHVLEIVDTSKLEQLMSTDDEFQSLLEKRVLNLNDHVLEIVDTSKLEQLMSTDDEFQSLVCKSSSLGDIVSHSDLVDGVYEGGLKVWECGIDLAKFLSSHSLSSTTEIEGKRVLELGCGAGIPGLYCVNCGAACVDFQDYNVEVLKLLTHTNVSMSAKRDEAKTDTECHYFAGDWEEFSEMDAHQDKYDIILTAETIYNVDNYPKLHKVCDKMLTKDGVVLIAAKEYYFGVGGGVESFLEFVNGQNCFNHETVWETKTGVPRKILMLKRRAETINDSKVDS